MGWVIAVATAEHEVFVVSACGNATRPELGPLGISVYGRKEERSIVDMRGPGLYM